MLNKRLENRITLKDFAEAIGAVEIVESYDFECGHTEYEEIEICFAHHYTIDEFESFEISENEEGKSLVVHQKTWGQCMNCDIFGPINRINKDAEKIYCSDMPKPEGFEKVTKYHGLAAYSGTFSPYEAIENAINLISNPSWEICCSTRPIGPIGLIIEGTVITASNIDLCSMIDLNNGKRFFEISKDDHRGSEGIIHYSYQLKKQWDHDEIVTTNNTAVAVWIKDWASKEFREYADKLCAMYDIPMTIIKTEEEYDDGK